MIRPMRKYVLLATAAAILFAGCKKDVNDYDVPTTYTFENVSYSGQTQRLNMLDEMGTYMETARTTGTVLDPLRLKAMFANEDSSFSFTSTKQLKDKCFLSEQTVIEQWMDSLAAASTSSTAGSHGVAGVVTSLDGTKRYLLSANGYDYTEMIKKGIMGAVFYYQATGVYLTDSKIGDGVDNETVTPGEGTAMQHHWDEAFGYFGVPQNFPTNTTARYWGKYSNEVDAALGTNKALMDAFLLGRAAIGADDHETKTTQAQTIRDTWEKLAAASAIHEFNEAKAALSDDAIRNHLVSEGIAFIRALKFNPTKKITDAQLQSLLDSFGTDLYVVTLPTIDAARNTLSGIYGLDSVKDQL
jgi:hypothetical protein